MPEQTAAVQALQWNPGSMESAGAAIGTLMAHGMPIRHPSGLGATTTLQLGDDGTGPIAQPGDWIVHSDGRWGVLSAANYERWAAVTGHTSGGVV